MNKQLQKKFDELENNRKQLLDSIRLLSTEALNTKPDEKSWSVATIIKHLMLAEEMSLKYLQKKTQDTGRADRTGFKNIWRMLIVRGVFFLDIKFKAPAIVTPEVSSETLVQLEQQWSATRADIYKILNALSEEDLQKELWKHALAGKLNVVHMLDFFALHTSRHTAQIQRTVRAVHHPH